MFLKTPKIKSRMTEITKALYRNFSFFIKDGFPKKHSKEIKFHIINKRNIVVNYFVDYDYLVNEFEENENALIHMVYDGRNMLFPDDELNLNGMMITYDKRE